MPRVAGEPADHRRGIARLGDEPLDLTHALFDPALVDREEHVLLRVEVRVHSTLGVAGGLGDLVDRGGVEALLDEEPVGGDDDLVARALLLLDAGNSHTAGICIPTVSEMQAQRTKTLAGRE